MRVLARLGSVKLAAWLIGIMLALCVVAFVVPQSTQADLTLHSEWSAANPGLARLADITSFDEIFTSPVFLITMVLLAINLTACTLNRMLRRRRRKIRVPSEAPSGSVTIDLKSDFEAASSLLRRDLRLWHLSSQSEGGRHLLHFDRGYWGFLGSMILHAGLLLVMVGGLISGLTRFDGRMVITEGETVGDVKAAYLTPPKEPKLGQAFHGFGIRLDSLRFDYEDAYLLQSHAQMTFLEDNVSEMREAAVNTPARWRGKSFLMVKGGHAVRIEVVDEQGGVIFPDGVVRLGNNSDGGSADHLELPDGRVLSIATVASLDDPETAALQKLKLRDPGVTFAIPGQEASVTVRPGSVAEVGDLSVSVSDVRLWNEFAVRQDRGIPVTYAAFGVILLGSALRFGFGKRTLWCYVQDNGDACTLALWSNDEDGLNRAVHALGGDERKTVG